MAKRIVKEASSQDLSVGSFTLTATAQGQMKIGHITLSASEGITETIVATIDQNEGADYDVPLDTSTLNSEQGYVYQSRGSELILNHGDSITLTCTNANTTGVVYGKILLVET